MTPTLTGYDRAEAAYLSQPEHRLTDERCAECGCDPDDHNADDTCGRCGDCDGYYVAEPCDLCGHAPCSCDAEYEAYRDRQMED